MQLQSLSSLGEKLPLTIVLFAVAIATAGVPSAHAATRRPCDIFASGTPCVAAYSTTRALYRKYTGLLYQVTRQSDKTSINIGLSDGYANAATQKDFCANTACTITKIYDQSPSHNDLIPAPPGGAAYDPGLTHRPHRGPGLTHRGPGLNGYDVPAVANALPVTVHGHQVYGIAISPGMGYRDDTPVGTAVNGQPEGVYMVTSALHLNSECCFDFGNAETNAETWGAAGHMDAINIMCNGNPCKPDAGLDMEDGIYGHLPVSAGTSFVTDMGANDGQHSYAIYQGNAQSGDLTSTGIIPLPKGYQPMKQEGAIILGIGGDNSNSASGYFFEGVMTTGMPSAKTMKAVQRNIVAAGYTGHLKP